ncbi:hypothetical protein WJX72_002208 [[Myrmecia] bisecta]|uniref:Uncharacterized protein n=1 Tax=[Myrmecia] bisecta TaxID=41462 RepID=A0AAW1QPJ7_9CHLO
MGSNRFLVSVLLSTILAIQLAAAQPQIPSQFSVSNSISNGSNAFYLGPTPADACKVGPSVYCLTPENMAICGVDPNTTIYASGYSSGKSPATTFEKFCSNKTQALAFNGGISQEPQPPKYAGVYQGWSQYCYSAPDGYDYSKCHVTGGLCPWANATAANFTQSQYEVCMRAEGIKQCQVPSSVPAALRSDFARYAPGYLGDDQTFLDHEYMKHGSCLGGYLGRNITAYFETAVRFAKDLTKPGTFAFDTVHTKRGSSIPYADFVKGLGPIASPQCTKDCKLSEIWYCAGRDASRSAFPTSIVSCPFGKLGSQ